MISNLRNTGWKTWTVVSIRVSSGYVGNLAYEIHGPVADYDYVYRKVWESGQKFGARKLGMHAYNEFNHTEAGFPNIHLHYPLPWFESDEGLAQYHANPMLGSYDINRKLTGSVGEDLESRFVTPYDVGWGFIVNFNHDFRGKEALEKIAEQPPRTVTTLEWNGEDVGKVFATMFTPGEEPLRRYLEAERSPSSENPSTAGANTARTRFLREIRKSELRQAGSSPTTTTA